MADRDNTLLDYTLHIADTQTRIAEALASLARSHQETMTTLGQQLAVMDQRSQTIAAILERVIQTTDRTEHMTMRLGLATPDKRSQ